MPKQQKMVSVALAEDGESLELLDQTLLPGRVVYLRLRRLEELWEAIRQLRVRGAPAIGIAAAYGMALAARELPTTDYDGFLAAFREKKAYLATARPTAVNLSWALEELERVVLATPKTEASRLPELLMARAQAIRDQDAAACRAIGEWGLTLLQPGCGVLTHCNAGALATAAYGTATAPIYLALERGWRDLRVYCDETRPLLQGARLTALELTAAGVDTTLLCDNMAASVLAQGLVDVILVGCDRVAANGDAANKIGTLGLAVLARHYGVPFYVCAPESTIDPACPNGAVIPIEQRPGTEVTEAWYSAPMAPAGVKVLNPAFDVTPAELITGVITPRGICRAPYDRAFAALGL